MSAQEGPYLVASGTVGNIRLGKLLKSLRQLNGYSKQWVAEQADISVSFVSGIERGAQSPSKETAMKILECFPETYGYSWGDGRIDLLIEDPEVPSNVAFRFKAEVKGQNRRRGIMEKFIDKDPTQPLTGADYVMLPVPALMRHPDYSAGAMQKIQAVLSLTSSELSHLDTTRVLGL